MLRPSVFGLAMLAVVVLAAVLRPAVADPSVAGLVWAGLLGALVLGVLWPALTVRTVGVRVLDAPTSLTTGQLATLRVRLTGRASGLSIGATGQGATVVDVVAPGEVRLPVSIVRRGAYGRIRITVGSDAPFGIVTATRTRVVDLPRQLLVGPEPLPVVVHPGELPADRAGTTPMDAGTTGESVRSVRPYTTGDPSHLVHWPSSARTGQLVVRELESPASRGLALVVDLGAPHAVPAAGDPAGDPVELAARRAAGAAAAVLATGARLVLCTAEAGGPVAGEVGDRLGVLRRLALAVPGPPAAPPDGWPVLHIGPEPAGAT